MKICIGASYDLVLNPVRPDRESPLLTNRLKGCDAWPIPDQASDGKGQIFTAADLRRQQFPSIAIRLEESAELIGPWQGNEFHAIARREPVHTDVVVRRMGECSRIVRFQGTRDDQALKVLCPAIQAIGSLLLDEQPPFAVVSKWDGQDKQD